MKIYRKSNSDDLTAFGAVVFVFMITVGPLIAFSVFYQEKDEVSTFSNGGHQYKKFYDAKKRSIDIVHDPDCPCQKQK
jgi:hypothetical protein